MDGICTTPTSYLKTLRSERGFTLIELLVTTTIIGILAAVVSIGVGGASASATTKANAGIFNQVQTSVDAYTAAGNTFPAGTPCPASGAPCGLSGGNLGAGFYGVTGDTSVTVAATTADTYQTINGSHVLVTPNTWLRLEGTTSLTCVFSGTTTTLIACK